MQLKEIETYKDLEIFIGNEIRRQKAEKQIVPEIKLNERWFKKLAVLVSFCMKNRESKDRARKREAEGCKGFDIKIDGTGCTIKRI